MNGKDVLDNLIDEIERARMVIENNKAALGENGVSSESINELLFDIRSNLERYYDHADSFDSVCEAVEIEPEKDDAFLDMD